MHTKFLLGHFAHIYLLSVEPVESAIESRITPNPANVSTKIKFESTAITQYEIKIFDILENEVFSKKVFASIGPNGIEVDCSNLKSGVYFYKISFANEVLRGKFLVVK